MSKKKRNTFRDAVLYNFSTDIMERYVMIEKGNWSDNHKDKLVKDINETLQFEIQKTNIYAEGRLLPYVIARRVFLSENNKIRVVIDEDDNQAAFCKTLNPLEYSHIVGISDGFGNPRRIEFGDFKIVYNARVIFDSSDEINAAVDVLLDIAMFHSYSFLSELSVKDKQLFNEKKMEFFLKRENQNYYVFDHDNPPTYVSLAFLARELNGEFDSEQYVYLWNSFIEEYYPDEKNHPCSPAKQILYHEDFENLPKELSDSSYWKKYSHGDYLLLRINRDPNDIEKRRRLCEFFGISTFYIGATKLVPITYYFAPNVQQNLRELIISGFKIVNC